MKKYSEKTSMIFFLLILFSISGKILYGQESEWISYYYGNRIWCIGSKDNEIWVGTNAGVARIDIQTDEVSVFSENEVGFSMTHNISVGFRSNGNVLFGNLGSGVSENYGLYGSRYWREYGSIYKIRAIVEDSSKYVWLGGGWQGIQINRYADNKIYHVARVNTSNSGLPGDDITCMKFDSSWNLWVGTESNGLAKYNGLIWETYNTQNSGIPSNTIYKMDLDNNNGIWLATIEGVAHLKDTTWTTFNTSNSPIPTNYIDALKIDSLGNLWIGPADQGLMKFDGKNWTTYTMYDSELPSNRVTCITSDKYNNLWIGTDAGVVKFYDGNWKKYNTSNFNFTTPYIGPISSDRRGNVWIATQNNFGNEGGLIKYDGTSWSFFDNSSLPYSSNIITITHDWDQNLWAAIPHGLLKYDDSEFNYYPADGISLYDVEKMSFDYSGVLWLASKSQGLLKFDNGSWESFNTSNSNIPSNRILDIAIKPQNIWLASDNGLICFDYHNDWKTYTTLNSDLPSNRLSKLATDIDGTIWIGTKESGLVKFSDNQWTHYTTDSGLLSLSVSALSKIGKNLFVGCKDFNNNDGGLVVFDGDTWISYQDEYSPLSSNLINSIEEDYNNNVWISGYGILSIFSTQEIEMAWMDSSSHNYTLDQNFPNPFNSQTVIRYELLQPESIKLQINNSLGQKIRTLVNEYKTEGEHFVLWDGRNDNGQKVSSGLYIYQIQTKNSVQIKKLILVK